jgi:hypothetical protein
MGNSLPTNASQLIGLGTKMNQGLIILGSALKITQITPAEFAAELNAFIGADGDFNAARSARQSASDVFKPADTALSEWLQTTRNILAARFGSRWSTMWAQAGFINSTTTVPSRIEERLGLALNLANFFTANPTFEVPSMQVTAAQATTLRDAALAAQQALAAADVVLKSKGDAWDSAYATLTGTMRALIKILGATIEDNDPRWLTFGLQMPATNTTPGQPVNVTAHLDGTGAIVVQCDPVPLATRYRWRMMRVGIDPDYQLAARSVDPIGNITGVLPGQTAQIIVQAVNGNLQGVASEPIQFTVLIPVVKAVEAKAAPISETAELSVNGNGQRNGQANGAYSRAA